jgi:hypothetical protein
MPTAESVSPNLPEARYAEALKIVLERASLPYLQRRLRCSYNEAKALLERMVSEGAITQYLDRPPTSRQESLAARLVEACRRDALTWADRKAIGEAIEHIQAAFVVPGGVSDAGFLQENDYHLLHRFIETSEDDESYDIGKDAIRRLAELGVVQSHGFGRYSVTMFGYWVHERFWHQNPALPLMTNADRDRAKRAALVAKGGL